MKIIVSFCAMTLLGAGAAQAQVELNTYADAKGNLDIQKLTCAQLANTFQEDADFMTVWYSGWYNGLAGYSKLKVDRAKELEHRVIVYPKGIWDKDDMLKLAIDTNDSARDSFVRPVENATYVEVPLTTVDKLAQLLEPGDAIVAYALPRDDKARK